MDNKESLFGKLNIINNDEVFMVTIVTDGTKLSTGYEGLKNFYISSGGGIILYETTYNGMKLTGEEKDKFYKQILSKEDIEKANENLKEEVNRLFGNEH